MTAGGYEYVGDAPAVGVLAWAPDRAGCLRQCALGVFNLIVATPAVAARETREVAARGASLEALVVNWLNECVYVHDLEGFVVADVAPPEITPTGVHAVLTGEPFDPGRHPRGTLVKGASSTDLQVDETGERVSIRVMLDI
jgi:SHS2 domain-containing protein